MKFFQRHVVQWNRFSVGAKVVASFLPRTNARGNLLFLQCGCNSAGHASAKNALWSLLDARVRIVDALVSNLEWLIVSKSSVRLGNGLIGAKLRAEFCP